MNRNRLNRITLCIAACVCISCSTKKTEQLPDLEGLIRSSASDIAVAESITKSGYMPRDIDKTDEYGMTPLDFAVLRGSSAIIKALVEKGADVNKPHEITYKNYKIAKCTPVMLAVLAEKKDMIGLLITLKADLETESTIESDDEMMYLAGPLELAAFSPDKEMFGYVYTQVPDKEHISFLKGQSGLIPVRAEQIHEMYSGGEK